MSVSRRVDGRRRPAFSRTDLFWTIAAVALLVAILLPTLSGTHVPSRTGVCASNLRAIGQGFHIYANENDQWFPHHYYTAVQDAGPRDQSVAVSWVGTMGSNDFLKITEHTSPVWSPDRSHPSRSLFLLVIGGNASPRQFMCPSSGDTVDDLCNRGPDSPTGGTVRVHGANRFDFRGYPWLSYGYQLPYGAKAKPRLALDPRVAIAADKGPYYCAAGEGLAGTGTIRDGRSPVLPPADWCARGVEGILHRSDEQWRPYNSRNHKGDGENVLFVDGHVEFTKRPIVGVNYDNIYTLQSGFDLLATMIGAVPDADHPLGPLTNTDTFIVP